MTFGNFRFGRQGQAYRSCFTIDPRKGAEAWERLSQNQLGLEIGMLPKTLHDALLETLKERRTLRKLLDN